MSTVLAPKVQSGAASHVVPAAKGHLDYLDGIRGAAALFVVLHHAWLQTWPILYWREDAPTKLVAVLTGWLMFGHFAVTIFITLSGFCLMIPVLKSGGLRGGVRGFALGRARRILPPYYAALIISVILATGFIQNHTHTPFDFCLPVTVRGVLLHVILLHNFMADVRAQINGPFWSIAVESQIYLLFPFLVWLWVRRGIRTVLVITAVLSAILWLPTLVGSAEVTVYYLFVFALGMTAALQAFPHEGWDQSWMGTQGFRVAGISAAILCLLIMYRYHYHLLILEDLLVGLISACCLVVIARDPKSLLRRIASLRPIVWVGGFSYSLYLMHFPLQQLFWQIVVKPEHFGKVTGFLLVAVPGTTLIVLMSYGFHRLFERPFMRSRTSVTPVCAGVEQR